MLAFFDDCSGDDDLGMHVVFEDEFVFVLANLDPDNVVAIFGGDLLGFETVFDDFAREQNGIDEVVDGRAGADAAKVRTNETASAIDGMALQTADALAMEDDFAASGIT